MWNSEILLPRLLTEVGNVWDAAERHVREHDCTRLPRVGEEDVTRFLFLELKQRVEAANLQRVFEVALTQDLESCGNPVAELNAGKWARGLAGTVTFHQRSFEGRTGGDLGMALLCPRFFDTTSPVAGLVMAPQGALCQAKITQNLTGLLGQLSPSQKKVLEGRLSYVALLLYRRSDLNGAPILPFEWFKCDRLKSIQEVARVLREANLPSLSSREFLTDLATGRFGTSDHEIISAWIAPDSEELAWAVDMRIDWPDGRPDTSEMAYQQSGILALQRQNVVVQIRA